MVSIFHAATGRAARQCRLCRAGRTRGRSVSSHLLSLDTLQLGLYSPALILQLPVELRLTSCHVLPGTRLELTPGVRGSIVPFRGRRDRLKEQETMASVFDRIRQGLCGMQGHDALLRFERDRVFLKCFSCGHESPGWTVSRASRAAAS